MFGSFISTQKVGKVADTLLGVAKSASAVSRLNQRLPEQYEAWRERRLLPHYRIIYLDGIHFTVRHGTQTDATVILMALGVDQEGSREVLAFRASAEEDKDGTRLFFSRTLNIWGPVSLLSCSCHQDALAQQRPAAVFSLVGKGPG